MADRTGIAARVRADLVWASGLFRLAEWRGQSASALICFDRVRSRQRGAFQPRRHLENSPQTLDRLIRSLKRWRVDVVTIDEACARLSEATPHRFVNLSFNGSYRDIMISAQPVLARHRVPFTVYVPSAFPDGIAEPWWLALEAAIAPHERISLVIDRKERHFAVADADSKTQLYDYLYRVMRGLSPADLSQTMDDLCTRYGVDMRALARDNAITWDDVLKLAADPLVTIGSATVNHPVLTTLDQDTARRDITMGRLVLETALRRPVRHFAFPFGDRASFTPDHVGLVREARFTSAVTATPAVLDARSDLHKLPRLVWNNDMTLRGLRARLAGY